MKTIKIIALACGLSLTCSAFATWQMVSSSSLDNHGPFFQAGTNNIAVPQEANDNSASRFADPFANTSSPVTNVAPMAAVKSNQPAYELHIYPGTLRSNVERLMKKSSYKLLWNSPYDYHVISQATVKGKNFNDALNRFLLNYPVRAVFYEQNNIMTIVPRTS